jgi:hypothetical protein
MRLEFHPEAELELDEAASFYEASLSGLGSDLGDEVERVIGILLEHPELGARLDENLRHFVLLEDTRPESIRRAHKLPL